MARRRTITLPLVLPVSACGSGSTGSSESGSRSPTRPTGSTVEQRAHDNAKETCASLGVDQVAAQWGGKDVVAVADHYAKATYRPEVQLAATRGCLEGFGYK